MRPFHPPGAFVYALFFFLGFDISTASAAVVGPSSSHADSIHVAETVRNITVRLMGFSQSARTEEKPRVTPSVRDRRAVCRIEGPRTFTSAFLPAVYEEGKSGSLSPMSLRQAWFMAGAGAGRHDASEIRTALKSCDDVPFEEMALVDLEAQSEHFNLTVGNALFVEKTFPIKQAYKDTLRRAWGALAMSVDFVNEPDEVMRVVNAYVSNKTRGVIPEILKQAPAPDTIMYLVNTLYFAANWAYKFNKRPVRPQLFIERGRAVRAQAMSREIITPFVNTTMYTAVSLPYERQDFEMLLVRPRGCLLGSLGTTFDLPQMIEGDLDATLREVVLATGAKEKERVVTVTMPRFHIKWRAGGNVLIPAFKGMGLNKVFGTGANFSGITDARPFYASEIIHQADVMVNEEGTIATAATVLGFSKSAIKLPKELISFTLDRPFLYAILHRPTQSILFAGWVNSDAIEVTEDVRDYAAPAPEDCITADEEPLYEYEDTAGHSDHPRPNATQAPEEEEEYSSPEDTPSTSDQTITQEGSSPEVTGDMPTPSSEGAPNPHDMPQPPPPPRDASNEEQTIEPFEDRHSLPTPSSPNGQSLAMGRHTLSHRATIAFAFLTCLLALRAIE